MVDVKYVEVTDNPNLNVATFELDKDLIKGLEKIFVPRNGELIRYIPMAKAIFDRSVSFTRVDISKAEAGATRVSIKRAPFIWSPADIEKMIKIIKKAANDRRPAVMTDRIVSQFDIMEKFVPKTGPEKLVVQGYKDRVEPVLALHGGAMELLGISFNNSGEGKAEVAMIGACNGCRSAQDTTFSKATVEIQSVFEAAQEARPDDAELKGKKFTGFTIREGIQHFIMK